MRICVTGHRGYIGSAFVDFAQRRLPEAKWLLVDKAAREEDDLLKADTVRRISEFKPEIIYNFAGASGEAQCKRDSAAWDLNAKVPGMLLERGRPRILVQASTCSLYGLGDAYTESKQYAENSLFGSGVGRAVIAFRFGTVYGANPSTMRWDLPLHRMVRDAVEKQVISLPNVRLMRPWLKLQELCRVLTRVAQDYERGIVVGGFHRVPLVSENQSLQFMAGVVLAGCGGVRVEYREHEADLRNYAAPALLGGGCSRDDIREIKEMLE